MPTDRDTGKNHDIPPELVAIERKPRVPTGKITAVSRQPHVDLLMEDLYVSLLEETRRLREAAVVEGLDELRFSRLIRASEAVVKLSKEQREKYKQENPEGMSDEELEKELRLLLEARTK